MGWFCDLVGSTVLSEFDDFAVDIPEVERDEDEPELFAVTDDPSVLKMADTAEQNAAGEAPDL